VTNGIDDILAPLEPVDPRETAGYRLLARLGEGGMGTVYLSHTRGGQPVAFKVIRREYGQDPDFLRRFEREVRAARRVQGYHLVPVVDHDTAGALPWIASAFVPGLSLADALAAYGPLPLPAVFQLVGYTARALGSIHAADVVHRDLKPGNILLGSTGPYVIDFGIAQAADPTQLTRSGGVIGTPQYCRPNTRWVNRSPRPPICSRSASSLRSRRPDGIRTARAARPPSGCASPTPSAHPRT
jgi:serine/threonine protein kinase